jgi:perosamine synthetase
MESVNDKSRTFVPALPTLWPEMLWAGPRRAQLPPFESVRAHYFYFARNAIWLTVKMLGLDTGEILVPAYHHGVEIEALIDAGASVRYYPVGAKWNVDVDEVRKRINERTRALYLIHYAGFPGPVQEMKALAEEFGLPLIEDCALSLLSSDGQQPLGTTGDVSIFCLYKTLPVPNGGALVINGSRNYSVPKPQAPGMTSTVSHLLSSLLQNMELRGGTGGRFLRRLVRGVGHGTLEVSGLERVPTGTQHFNRDHVELGMSPLTRRIALSQDLAGIVERRRRNYFFLLGRLREVSAPLFHQLPAGVCPLFYPLIVDDKDAVYQELRARGVEAIDFWRHFHPSCDATKFPEVARLRNTVLEIPCHQDLSPEAMARLALTVREAVQAARARKGTVKHARG